jgi:uncharacterized membrane protein YoaK (UPF0700 family)
MKIKKNKNESPGDTGSEGIKIDDTLRELARAPREGVHISVLIPLLTLNAGWTDLLAYLFLSKIFASFMTGNILFIGLALAQANIGLLVRAVVALLVNFVGVTIGSLVIHRAPLRQTARRWRNRIMLTLLVQWIFLLAFTIVWFTTSNLTQQDVMQILILGLAAFAMGIQAAIVVAFEFPGVIANAMTGVVIVIGRRIGKGIVHAGPEGEWRWTFLLPVIYALGAIAVALTSASPLTPIFPLITSTVAIIYIISQVGVHKIKLHPMTTQKATMKDVKDTISTEFSKENIQHL